MTTTDSNLLKAISVSFDHAIPSTSSVEINLTPNSPIVLEQRPENIACANASSLRGNSSSGPTAAFSESRNDHEMLVPLSPPASMVVPSSIFRTNNDPSADSSSSAEDAPVSEARHAGSDHSKCDSTRKTPPLTTAREKPTYYSSVSYDALFEVRKSQSSKHGVTTMAAGEGSARSISILYDELRTMTSTSLHPLDDEDSFEKHVSVGVSPRTMTGLAKRVTLQERAGEMILEARNACASHDAASNMPTSRSSKFGRNNTSANKDYLHQKLKRTQSLDRVLSTCTKEVLDLATQALEQKEKSTNRIKKSISLSESVDDSAKAHSDTTIPNPNTIVTSTTTNEQEVMLGRQVEKGMCIPHVDRQLDDTLVRIQAKSICLPSLSSSGPGSCKSKFSDEDEDTSQTFPSFMHDVSTGSHDRVLKRLDGIKDADCAGGVPTNAAALRPSSSIEDTQLSPKKKFTRRDPEGAANRKEAAPFSLMNYLWGGDDEDGEGGAKGIAQQVAPMLACGPAATAGQLRDELEGKGVNPYQNKFASMATSLMKRKPNHLPSFAETAAHRLKADPRMRDWIDGQFAPKDELPNDGSYLLGKSRTVVVHEIVRGNWTWCTCWSPDGQRLAIATENHHLAIVDTRTSVWRVRHDQRLVGPVKNDSTHSIRSISWGAHFIAIGGTGDAVSILATAEPYPILHTIKGTGFVGSLDWRNDSTVLAIGTRTNKALIVKISHRDNAATGRQLQSEILQTIQRQNWANAVAFSPGGNFFAVGDASGQLSIYRYDEKPDANARVIPVASFTMEDSILAVSFSPCGQWLYAGGEDFRLTVIDTNHWEIVHRLRRNRWVQCIASSRGGTHVAVGGVSSEVSILEIGLGWDTVINIELSGLVPLDASWHPRDQYLALTGQNKSILVVETTNARHISGHFLRSISPILDVSFSPSGRLAAVGNEQGVITFFALQGGSFVTTYEMVVTIGKHLNICWSPDGQSVLIGAQNLLLVVGRSESTEARPNRPANSSGFSIRRVMRGLGDVKAVTMDPQSRYIAASGTKTSIIDAKADYRCVRSFDDIPGLEANAWSSDGRWMATIGQSNIVTVYETSGQDCDQWRDVVTLEGTTHAGLAVTFGPQTVAGLVYLAYGGEDKCVTVVEIRTNEGTWETVLTAPRGGAIHDLDWNSDGLLAAAISNGTVCVMDLSYLKSGFAVNEMNYNAQRQALTCFTEIRRNRGRNCMRTVTWIPSAPGSCSMLAVGGTDGEVEIVDLTNWENSHGDK